MTQYFYHVIIVFCFIEAAACIYQGWRSHVMGKKWDETKKLRDEKNKLIENFEEQIRYKNGEIESLRHELSLRPQVNSKTIQHHHRKMARKRR